MATPPPPKISKSPIFGQSLSHTRAVHVYITFFFVYLNNAIVSINIGHLKIGQHITYCNLGCKFAFESELYAITFFMPCPDFPQLLLT